MRSPGANPMRCATVRNFDKVKRRLFCRSYDACLDYAVSQNWPGFTCLECRYYEFLQWDRDSWLDDNRRCMAILYFISILKEYDHVKPGNLIDLLEMRSKEHQDIPIEAFV